MILAAGLSPAWQRILVFDEFRTGEVNRAAETHACASGKVINVGRALIHLGADPHTLTAIGGATGQGIRDEFDSNGIPATWIETDVPTRTCTTILDRSIGATTELVENTRPIGRDALDEFAAAFRTKEASADIVIVTGSNPAGTPPTLYRDLIRGITACCILDIRGEELLAALEQRPFVVKPNRAELAATIGRELTSDEDLLHAMRELNGRGAEWVVVTDGARSVWVTSAGDTLRYEPPRVDVVNPIGCGDCLAAGLAWGIAQGLPIAECVKLGLAAAADNVGQMLPARLDASRVRRIAATVQGE